MPITRGDSVKKRQPSGHIRNRFSKAPDKLATAYTQSISYDWRLYSYDIAGSVAHARMLAKQGIIPAEDGAAIVRGLKQIKAEIDSGTFNFRPELEDIHMNIEARLLEIAGDAGGKLHTARSRNDQIATDLRLYLKQMLRETIEKLKKLQGIIIDQGEANIETIMPGYTHLQPAQPVLLAHHWLAYFEMLQRDVERFRGCFSRADVLPLGSGALAGVGYDVDRLFVACELGFSRLSRNSIDAVSDRDFVIEYEAAAATAMMHLSRLAEELVIWSTAEFNFIEIDDAFTTSSSIMPQKKNPDVAELARGKAGRVFGHLQALLTVMKGLPLAYDRDLQEDKEGLFDTVDTLLSTLDVFAGMMAGVAVHRDVMLKAAGSGYTLATELADYLVKHGEPFRSAHGVVARLIRYSIEQQKPLERLSLKEYKKFSPAFKSDILKITVNSAIAARNIPGGTAPAQVREALKSARQLIGDTVISGKNED